MFLSYAKLTKIFIVLMIIILVVTINHFEEKMTRIGNKFKMSQRAESRLTLAPDFTKKPSFLKVFHLDLKGGPPKLSYLRKVVPIARESGANAVLIEYEDMFPFYGKLRNISAVNAYPLEELKKFVEFIESLEMEVIPLVQTFGHLEYVLKLEEFQHLREHKSFPQEICPSKNEAIDLVKEIIRQVMSIHSNSRHLHIGCDEVRNIGTCPLCSRTSSKKIFSKHVRKVANHVSFNYPGVTPLIWDDMMRRWTFEDLAKSVLGSIVEPVVWIYSKNIFTLVPRSVWNIYLRTFPKIWVASAFKGAFGETEILPDLKRHHENNMAWLKVLANENEEIIIRPDSIGGIFVTGWSRYDHFAVLCELLPVGIPSLVLSLLSIGGHFHNRIDGLSRWLKILNCSPNINDSSEKETFFQDKLGNCSFPGSNLYSAVTQFQRLRSRLKDMTRTIEVSGWVSKYNYDKNFSSPWRVVGMFPGEGFGGRYLKKEVSKCKDELLPFLGQYFDDHTVTEWEEQNIRPVEEKLKEIFNDFLKLVKRRTWPRRPVG